MEVAASVALLAVCPLTGVAQTGAENPRLLGAAWIQPHAAWDATRDEMYPGLSVGFLWTRLGAEVGAQASPSGSGARDAWIDLLVRGRIPSTTVPFELVPQVGTGISCSNDAIVQIRVRSDCHLAYNAGIWIGAWIRDAHLGLGVRSQFIGAVHGGKPRLLIAVTAALAMLGP